MFFIKSLTSVSTFNGTCQEQVAQIKQENQEKLTLGRREQSKCNLFAFKKHWANTEKVLQQEIIKHMKEFRQQIRLDRKLCDKIEDKYLPFGLDYMVPDSLQCEFNIKGIYRNFTRLDEVKKSSDNLRKHILNESRLSIIIRNILRMNYQTFNWVKCKFSTDHL